MTRRKPSSSRPTRSSSTPSEGRGAFAASVFRCLAAVPRGKVTTYAAIAEAVGRPGAAQAVGNALHANPEPIAVPCHRVVRSDGSLGGYALGRRKKAALLAAEGVASKGGKTDLETYGIDAKHLKAKNGTKGRKRTL